CTHYEYSQYGPFDYW
nr:immunoglobulin heavy chain junction region [Macaca mulatta]MOW86954.1 immunoglobulin heavy chain junction region [Macaca mulatta]MOW87511.1 immunoglobulin heavy chain junction region [Macaca mulatta]MOW87610.1 immunoglobulin heavy chain junction region [Macaca mulatta]MOW87993.1 immunoglobulin heavy chain junction region [Macaca mulatta]